MSVYGTLMTVISLIKDFLKTEKPLHCNGFETHEKAKPLQPNRCTVRDSGKSQHFVTVVRYKNMGPIVNEVNGQNLAQANFVTFFPLQDL